MKKIITYLNENPGMETYVVTVEAKEIPRDLKLTTLKESIERIIGKCEVKLNTIGNSGILNFRITKIQGV